MTLKVGEVGQLTGDMELEYEVVEAGELNSYRGIWPLGTVVVVAHVYETNGVPDAYNFEILGIGGCWDCELSDITPMQQ